MCTANINRSPTAAAFAQRTLTHDHFIAADVRSASARGWSGEPAGAYTIDAMRELGFDLREHVSRAMSVDLLGWADKVIVMEDDHAERAIAMAPDAEPRIVRLWHFLDEEHGHMPDPHGQDLDNHREAVRRIQGAVAKLVDELLTEWRAAARARRGT